MAIIIEQNQAYSSLGHHLHRLGTENYFLRSTLLPGDTAASFEEVEAPPAYTRSQYEARAAELVRARYSEAEEFALHRKAFNSLRHATFTAEEDTRILSEFAEYNAYVEQCKQQAKEMLEEEEARRGGKDGLR